LIACAKDWMWFFQAARTHGQHLFRRDQRAFCFSATGLAVAPFSLRRRLFRFAKIALVTSGNRLAATTAGFRLRLGGGVALRLRSRRLSTCAALSPLAARRPKP